MSVWSAEGPGHRSAAGDWPLQAERLPHKRINQRYLAVTSAKNDVAKVKVPDHINDAYFAR